MLGKQIAENLRQNRDKWGRFYYYKRETGKYCVIGLKLHELGVPVEKWGSLTHGRLSQLQHMNDEAESIDALIQFAEKESETDFPLEALAERLKAQ